MSDAKAMGPSYRPEIDGLRSIAVGGVVLFHAGLSGIGGGYVGVDVFFVISGYLITGILLRDSSILNFYQRRFRRILPALLAMMVIVMAVGVALMLPRDLIDLGRSIAAACAFISNIFFWRQAGYFKPEVELMPMLHTWSLGVEEQFYIFFPLLVILLKKTLGTRLTPKFYAIIFTVLALGSLGLAAVAVALGQAQTAFYLIPTRAWELLIGSVLATGALPAVRQAWMRNVLAIAGMAAVIIPMFAYDKYTPFPGITALPPVLGTAAIIYASTHGGNIIARILSLRPFVAIGLISYSLYLWHWPVLAILRYRIVREPTFMEASAAVLLAVLLAYLSWAYVERPFRKGFSDATIWRLSGAGLVTTILLGLAVSPLGGLPGRFDPRAVALNEQTLVTWRCPVDQMGTIATGRLCDLGLDQGSPQKADIILWGDSHAQMYGPAFAEAVKGHPAAIVHAYGCAPVMQGDDCGGRQEELFRLVRATDAKLVVMAQSWAGVLGDPTEQDSLSATEREARYTIAARQMAATVKALRASGKQVMMIEPIPRPGYSVPTVLSRELAFYHQYRHPQAMSLAQYRIEFAPVLKMMGELAAKDSGVRILPVTADLCRDATCRYVAHDSAIYADVSHLETGYVRSLAPIFRKEIGSMIAGTDVQGAKIAGLSGNR